MFVAHFNYSKDDFYRLTPYESSLILDSFREKEDEYYSFWQNELRQNNFFIHKSSMGGGNKSIRKPDQLYPLFSEIIEKEKSGLKAGKMVNKPIPGEDLKFIQSLM